MVSKKIIAIYFYIYSTAENPGKHWFIVFVFDDVCEVFDSLGANPHFIKTYLPKYSKYAEYNTSAVQSKTSKLCGEYCLYFIINRLLNLDLHFEEVCNILFSDNCEKNEKQVVDFIENE